MGNNGQTALATTSARFVSMVEQQFASEMGAGLAWTEYEKTLAQHLFLKVDAQLAALEAKRLDGNNAEKTTPITWQNVNLPKLALDGVHRISLGLDALIPNHVHPIPYWNKRISKYDLDLRIGYVGKDFCRRKLAVEEPVDVIYELVYSTDKFKPIMRSRTNEIEGYEFEIVNPFDRGKVIGGFVYIIYADPKKNRLVMVTERDFQRAESAARTKDFWGADKSQIEMKYKTMVHRVTDKLPLDPRKVNAKSYAYVEAQEADASFEQQVADDANGQVIDTTATAVDDGQAPAADNSAPSATVNAPAQQTTATAATAPSPGNGVAQQQTLAGPGF